MLLLGVWSPQRERIAARDSGSGIPNMQENPQPKNGKTEDLARPISQVDQQLGSSSRGQARRIRRYPSAAQHPSSHGTHIEAGYFIAPGQKLFSGKTRSASNKASHA